jgi:SAM-dependent methyltransferase
MSSPSLQREMEKTVQRRTPGNAPANMRPEITAACEMIAGRDCEKFLRVMRCAYFGDHEGAWKESEALVERAEQLGLLKVDRRRLTLTSGGYLVGNVAKEYINYVEQGRQVVAPKPPVEFFSDKDVLDLGCSFGRWLWEFQRRARSATGIEMQLEYIQLGAALAEREGVPTPRLIQDSIENLDRHVPPQSMDLVFSRLVFNYVAIKPTLKKAIATLRPGGVLWLEVGPFAGALSDLVNSEPRLRSKMLSLFQLANSVLCTATGWQMALRTKGRMHSVHKPACPTLGWWRRVIRREGLTDFRVVRYHPHGVAFCANKPR